MSWSYIRQPQACCWLPGQCTRLPAFPASRISILKHKQGQETITRQQAQVAAQVMPSHLSNWRS